MALLLQQLKQRRLDLGLKQNDMMLRVGILRQQYQRLESKGNPRLNTIELIAKGLNSTIMLVPNEKLNAVLTTLKSDEFETENCATMQATSTKNTPYSTAKKEQSLVDNPWQNLLEDDDA